MRCFRCFRQLLLGLLAIAAGGSAHAQAVVEHELKAAFIFNFIQFTEWPDEAMKGGTLNVCISAGSILHMALAPVAGKVVHHRLLTLLPLPEEPTSKCHVLIADASDRVKMALIGKLAANKPVLTVTDDPEFMREGFMIGMLLEGKRISFIVDNTRANTAKLTISSRLLRLARNVQ